MPRKLLRFFLILTLTLALPLAGFLYISAAQSPLSSDQRFEPQGAPDGGQFLAAPVYPAGTYPNDIVVGDFNRDGILDLASEDRVGGLEVLLGNANGTFQPAVVYPAGKLPYGIAERLRGLPTTCQGSAPSAVVP
jgi:hypothetical protein